MMPPLHDRTEAMPQKLPPLPVLLLEILVPSIAVGLVFVAFEMVTGKSWGGAPIGAVAGIVAVMQYAPQMQAMPAARRRLITLGSALAGASVTIAAMSLIG
jgi:hypothetical protein